MLTRCQRRMPRHFSWTVRNVTEAVMLNTFDETLAETQGKTLGDKLEDVKGKALSEILVDTPPQQKVLPFDDTMGDMTFKLLVDTRGRQERGKIPRATR